MFGFFESSRTLGVPTELFLFQVGDDLYAYTDAEDAITHGGVTYQPVPISRNEITASGGLDKSQLTVTLAQSVDLCAVLRGYPVSTIITLRIRQGHREDPDSQYLIAWAGRVLSSKGKGAARELSCQPISTGLNRVGLRRNWQYGCPHALYGDRCRASRLAATVNLTVSASNKATVQFGAAVANYTKYQGGLLAWDGEVRTIVRTPSANTFVLGGPAPPPGTAVAVSLGCDHTTNDCSTLHVPIDEAPYGGGNIHNYGGQPFIPTTSPIGFVSNFG